jgi:hypothetical protein
MLAFSTTEGRVKSATAEADVLGGRHRGGLPEALDGSPEGARPMTRCLEALATDVRRMIGQDRPVQEVASEAGRTEAREWFLRRVQCAHAATIFHELEWK